MPQEEGDLRRSVFAWFDLVVQRTFPDAIIPEGVNLKEAPMLEQTLIKWRSQIEREARQEALLKDDKKGGLKECEGSCFGR